MLRKTQDQRVDMLTEMRGGKGTVAVHHLLEKAEFHDKGRLFARNVIPPGASIGDHPHKGDFEAYYVLSGTGLMTDDDRRYEVGPGDLIYTDDGHLHGLANAGSEDLVVIALVLFS